MHIGRSLPRPIDECKVVDVGSGNGMMVVLLRKEGFAHITATDYLQDSVGPACLCIMKCDCCYCDYVL